MYAFVVLIKAGGPDYYIKGVLNRNRAFNDDVVVVNVLPPDQWEVRYKYNTIPCCLTWLSEQLIAQAVDEDHDAGDDGKEADEIPASAGTVLTPKHSHKEEDTSNNVSAVTQNTLTLDSTPAIGNDHVKADGSAAVSSEDSHTNIDNIIQTDSVPSVAKDNTVKVTAELSTFSQGELSQTSSDGGTDEVCFYYDSKQYDRILGETFRAVHGDSTDDGGDLTTISAITPNLDQIINGHPLRMYKRTAKVL